MFHKSFSKNALFNMHCNSSYTDEHCKLVDNPRLIAIGSKLGSDRVQTRLEVTL